MGVFGLSEIELCRHLDQAGRVGADDLANGGAADVSINGGGSKKLRMVWSVKGFHSPL
jgi:hypothetical protein